MFTGLIQDIGTIRDIDTSRGDLRIEIETQMNLSAVQVGASIACSGCCLTVVDKAENTFFVDISAETLSKTTIDAWKVMTRINLESSLKVGDEMGGHFVSGHVDAVTEILDIKPEGDSHRLTIAIPDHLKKYIAPKGSITLDGVSLTVNEVDEDSVGKNIVGFGVNIIPHTWEKTTLSDRRPGDKLNMEIDMLARYVARMMEIQQ